MKNTFAGYLNYIITLLLLIVAGVTPLLFLNQTTEFFEMPKLAFLIVMTVVLLGLWIFSWIVKGKVSITRTPLDIPLLLLLIVVVVSTYLSPTRYEAIYGNFPTVHGSAVAWVTYILLYFVTVSHLKNISQIRSFLYVIYGSAVVVATISLLSFFTIFLPFDFAKAVNFTPTGSSFSTIAFLLLLLPFPLLSLLNPNKYLPVPVAVILATLFGVTIALIGSIPSFFALLIACTLCLLVSKPNKVRAHQLLFFIPIILTFFVLLFAYVPFQGNALQQMEVNFPKEIQLPFAISWKVTASAFRDAPFIGTGPSSYLFNFTTYKPAEFNALKYWNFSFDTAYDEFLQILGTLGIFGFFSLILLCLVIFNTSWKNLSYTADIQRDQDNAHLLLQPLAISGLLAIVLLAIHATTLVSIVMTFFILAALMMSQKSVREKVTEFSMGIKASTADNRQFDLFPIIIFIVFLIAAVPVLYQTANAVAADYYHRKALSQANQNGTLTYSYLQKAETLNPQIDLYRVDMAQTNFALANALAVQKGPTKANPKGSLTDQDKQTIQTLLSQSVNEGRIAVALSPRSARNWEVLGSIYQNITGVAKNALDFALDAYGQAIQRDPVNPSLRVTVGGIYYSVKNYSLAIRFFSDAANLKPDYVLAYYNLAIALRDSGDVQDAVAVAQQTVALLGTDKTSPDYKVAAKLLADLNAKIPAANSAQTAQPTPAIATSSAALQNPNLPSVNVSNLNNPPKVTPAPSVKPNPNSNLPQVSAAPSVSPASAPKTR